MARRLTSTEWFGISVLAFLVATCSYALGAITGSWLVGLASLIVFPLALASLIGVGLAVAFVTVAIHEAGHFYAGRRAGLEPVVFHLMFWEWVRWKGSARCRRHRGSRQLSGTVHVVCWDEPPSLRKYLVCVAAGPLASFAAAGLVLGSYLLLGGDFTIENLNAMSYVWLWFGAMNLLMFVFSAIPCGSNEGPASDGLVLWNLLRHQERSRAELRLTCGKLGCRRLSGGT